MKILFDITNFLMTIKHLRLTLFKVNEVLTFLAVSSAAILWPLHYVRAVSNVVADGKTLEAALTVPKGLPSLTDLWWRVTAVLITKTNRKLCILNELKCFYDNCDIYTVNHLLNVTENSGDFMCLRDQQALGIAGLTKYESHMSSQDCQ